MNSIGKRIYEKRKEQNMTLKDVQTLADVPTSTLNTIEKGKSQPSAETIIKLSELFKCTTDWLLKGTQNHSLPDSQAQSSMEREYLEAFQMLSDYDQEEILRIIKLKLELKKARESSNTGTSGNINSSSIA